MTKKQKWEDISFKSGENLLHGLLSRPEGNGGQDAAIICHPHPLYGGDMGNGLVVAMGEALSALGMPVLRFDFRGTGRSEGDHDGVAEVDDLAAAADFLKKTCPSVSRVHLAGYSWGLTIALALADREGSFPDVCGVAPPVGFMDCSKLGVGGSLKYFILGTRDGYAPLQKAREWIATRGGEVSFDVIEGADHFFFGKTVQVAAKISDFISKRMIGA